MGESAPATEGLCRPSSVRASENPTLGEKDLLAKSRWHDTRLRYLDTETNNSTSLFQHLRIVLGLDDFVAFLLLLATASVILGILLLMSYVQGTFAELPLQEALIAAAFVPEKRRLYLRLFLLGGTFLLASVVIQALIYLRQVPDNVGDYSMSSLMLAAVACMFMLMWVAVHSPPPQRRIVNRSNGGWRRWLGACGQHRLWLDSERGAGSVHGLPGSRTEPSAAVRTFYGSGRR